MESGSYSASEVPGDNKSEQQVPTVGKVSTECPFDIEAVFTLQYSTEGLKGILKWIIENLGEQKQAVGK